MEKVGLLSGKVCLVTGASKGIGLSIVKRLAAEGGIVYANIRSKDSLDDNLLNLFAENTTIKPSYFDVTKPDELKNAVMEIKKSEGKIDVLVNNAGIVTYELLPMINFDKLALMLETNVVAVIRLTQLVSRIMARQNSGSIINISSIVGVKGVKGQLAYSATKGAVNSITLSAAKELASNNIRVNAIAPGMVETDRLKSILADKFADRINDIGFGRMADPEEIANTCLYLASDLSTYMTGQILGVDGGTIL
jgi:3-oxoacyl-[acyl-carrier protein] reductase